MKTTKVIAVFVLSVLVAYLLGSATSSLIIASNVAALGVEVSFIDRLGWIGHDLAGMAAVYLPILVVGFAIAFAVTALILKASPGLRTIGYVLAGGVALFAIHQLLYLVTDIHGLPATRSTLGLGLQVIAGIAGGYVFARVGAPQTS
ncbi:MAG: hypothetical protein O3A63_13940 [Proteobacteria bacterium]|nr:hypothetical protein [Pseudomonadota bacterium]